MLIRKKGLKSGTALSAACAALWLGSAIAAPLPPSYPANSAALFASVMHDPAPLAESEANAAVATDCSAKS